jgi:AraC-like DNA-binding protein
VDDVVATSQLCRPPRLAGLVDHLWHSAGLIPERRERVLPNGTFEIVLSLGDRHRLVDRDRLRVLPAASFGGLRAAPFILDHPDRCDTLGIVLRPAGAFALLRRPLSEVVGLTVDARELLGPDVDELAERCAETHDPDARFALVARWLWDRIARARAPDSTIAWMAAQIEASAGELRVGALQKETGLSKARVIERFRAQIGVRPKLYARLVRFRRVLDCLQRGDLALADVALEAGYYDQAHLSVEFREFAGLSPTAFIAASYQGGSGNTAREPSSTDGPVEAASA